MYPVMLDEKYFGLKKDSVKNIFWAWCQKNYYQRLSFEGIDLFGDGQVSPETLYPSPQPEDPAYIFKGPHAAESNEITYLYLDMYYEKDVDVYAEAFSYPLQVYVSEVELEPYDFSKELPAALTEGLIKITVENSKP